LVSKGEANIRWRPFVVRAALVGAIQGRAKPSIITIPKV
jgi:hypothetical protein